MKKRILALTLAIIMSIGLVAACSGDSSTTDAPADAPPAQSDSSSGDTSSGESTPAEPSDDNPYAEHIVFTASSMAENGMGMRFDPPHDPSPAFAWLMEKFNFEFENYLLSWGDYVDATRLWLAGGQAPELIFLDVNSWRYAEFYQNATVDNYFRPYNLDVMPNAKAMFENAKQARVFEIDGSLYAWPSFLDFEAIDFRRAPGTYYRKDLAEATGLYQEDGVYTFDEWCELVLAVKDANPGMQGMAGPGWALQYLTLGVGSSGYTGYTGDYVTDGQGGYTWAPLLPSSVEDIKLLNQLYKDGILHPDQIFMGDPDAELLIQSNLLFASISSGVADIEAFSDYLTAYADANNIAYDEACERFAIGFIESPNGGLYTDLQTDYWSLTAMNANMSDEKAERWQAILDYLVSDEGYIFRVAGVPGQHWEYDADGNVVLLWGEDGDPGDGFANWEWARMATAIDFTGITIPDLWDDYMYESLSKAISIITAPDVTVIETDYDLAFFVGEYYGSVDTGMADKMLELLRSNNPEEEWNAWVDQMRPIVQPVIDELNRELGG